MLIICGLSCVEQDEGLEKLGETVLSTKHIALAVNEELNLHTRLIVCSVEMDFIIQCINFLLVEDHSSTHYFNWFAPMQETLDQQVDVTDSRLQVAFFSFSPRYL